MSFLIDFVLIIIYNDSQWMKDRKKDSISGKALLKKKYNEALEVLKWLRMKSEE
jgi:hypothetical protein